MIPLSITAVVVGLIMIGMSSRRFSRALFTVLVDGATWQPAFRRASRILRWPGLACVVAGVVLLGVATRLQAQESDEPPDFPSNAIRHVSELSERFLELARDIPAESYTDRPMAGARSAGELFMHVASSCYFHLLHLGVPIPKGSFRGVQNLETIEDPAVVLEVLEAALRHAESSLETLEAEGELDGRWDDLHGMTTHLHHHMGQATVYARLAGIVPPWTEREEQMRRERDRAAQP